jgi:hypothetical protein
LVGDVVVITPPLTLPRALTALKHPRSRRWQVEDFDPAAHLNREN